MLISTSPKALTAPMLIKNPPPPVLSVGILLGIKVVHFCSAIWCTFTLPLTLKGYNGDIPIKIGEGRSFLFQVMKVEQFLSGMFLGVPAHISSPCWEGRDFSCDHDALADLGDAIIAIEAQGVGGFKICGAHKESFRGLLAAIRMNRPSHRYGGRDK